MYSKRLQEKKLVAFDVYVYEQLVHLSYLSKQLQIVNHCKFRYQKDVASSTLLSELRKQGLTWRGQRGMQQGRLMNPLLLPCRSFRLLRQLHQAPGSQPVYRLHRRISQRRAWARSEGSQPSTSSFQQQQQGQLLQRLPQWRLPPQRVPQRHLPPQRVQQRQLEITRRSWHQVIYHRKSSILILVPHS